ncbi:LysM peptidoglycan-binding domain-containing protein [Dokdonella sp.]|uniref:LysM peptidoglycan-binding domain-containing protein n=1 Tax=Dokdonella sp. TaxID=2291710 RepID=UPI0031C7B47A|nr:LysM peptidoglycan-binding domain-containing protein [Dokdonella sp.]
MGNDPRKADFSNVGSGATSTAPKAAPKADFGNVQAGVDSTAATPEAATERTYTVVSGDNLSRIAKHFYGKASRWHAIFEANRDQLDNPDLIRPGQVLRIPADTTDSND